MDREEIQDEARDEDQIVYPCVTGCFRIGQDHLFHRFCGLPCGQGPEMDPSVSGLIDLDDHIVPILVSVIHLVRVGHHHAIELEDGLLIDLHAPVIVMDVLQSITVPCDLHLIMVQGCRVMVHQRGYPLIGGHDSLYGVRFLDRQESGLAFHPGIDRWILPSARFVPLPELPYLHRCPEQHRRYAYGFQETVIERTHNNMILLHILNIFLCNKIR